MQDGAQDSDDKKKTAGKGDVKMKADVAVKIDEVKKAEKEQPKKADVKKKIKVEDVAEKIKVEDVLKKDETKTKADETKEVCNTVNGSASNQLILLAFIHWTMQFMVMVFIKIITWML